MSPQSEDLAIFSRFAAIKYQYYHGKGESSLQLVLGGRIGGRKAAAGLGRAAAGLGRAAAGLGRSGLDWVRGDQEPSMGVVGHTQGGHAAYPLDLEIMVFHPLQLPMKGLVTQPLKTVVSVWFD